jgi:hypothetical protein
MNNTKSPHVQEVNQNTLGCLQNPPKLFIPKCESVGEILAPNSQEQ